MNRHLTKLQRCKLFALDLLFPNRCGCCGKFIAWDALLCPACTEALSAATVCGGCGKSPCVCGNLPYRAVLVPYQYDGVARDGVLEMKTGTNLNFAEWLGLMLAERLIDRYGAQLPADCIVPVPATRQRLRERGCNQAAVIAKTIGRVTKLPVREDCLVRKSSASVQHYLRAGERRENAKHYESGGQQLAGARVLLCDDVLTTGATAAQCASLLLAQNAASVILLAGTTTLRKAETHGHRN